MIEPHPPLESIVIVGCQRSGTTLLGQVLGAHKDCFLVDEFEGLYPWYKSWMDGAPVAVNLLQELVTNSAKKYQDKRHEFSTIKDLSASIIVAKAPNLTYRFVQLSRHHPRPKVVFMVRDVRAVVASMMQLSRIDILGNQIKQIVAIPQVANGLKTELEFLLDDSKPHFLRLAMVWKIKTGIYKSFQAVGLKPYVLKYEDLIRNTQVNTAHVLDYCGLTAQCGSLDYTQVMQGQGPGNTSREVPVNSRSLCKWKNKISPDQALSIMELCADLMVELGYEA
jgi:hypothetical protein